MPLQMNLLETSFQGDDIQKHRCECLHLDEPKQSFLDVMMQTTLFPF